MATAAAYYLTMARRERQCAGSTTQITAPRRTWRSAGGYAASHAPTFLCISS